MVEMILNVTKYVGSVNAYFLVGFKLYKSKLKCIVTSLATQYLQTSHMCTT